MICATTHYFQLHQISNKLFFLKGCFPGVLKSLKLVERVLVNSDGLQ